MSKTKRIISILLAVVMAAFIAAPAALAEGEVTPTENIPILRIRSNVADLYWYDDEGNKYKLYDDGEYVSGIVDAALPYAALGVATGNWNKWCDAAWEQIKPAYDHLKPDAQGNLPAESPAAKYQAPESYTRKDAYGVDKCYQIYVDQRIAPVDGADYINEVVERIKTVTGHDKVHIVAQCMGGAYALSWLYKYEAAKDYADVASLTLSTVTSKGTPGEDALFSGNMRFDLESAYQVLEMYKFPKDITNIAGGTLIQVIYDTLDLLYNSKVTGKVTLAMVQNVYNAVKDKFIGRMLREYYGRCGGYVSLVNDHYDQYKDYVFPTAEDKETYAAQIAKFDEYRNIQLRQDEIISDVRDHGINVCCFVQYGWQYGFVACGELGLETSDQTVPASRASFGATAARFGGKLSDEYIAERVAAGYGKYISPDKEIDASTGLLPDSTWYVKNVNHNFDVPDFQALVTAVVRTPDADIYKLAEQGYSQFSYNKHPAEFDTDERNYDSLVPLTGEETDVQTPVKPQTQSFFKSLIAWFRSLFDMIKALLGK